MRPLLWAVAVQSAVRLLWLVSLQSVSLSIAMPTNQFDTLHPLVKLFTRIAWLSGAGPILTLGVLISGPKAFKYFDLRNVLK